MSRIDLQTVIDSIRPVDPVKPARVQARIDRQAKPACLTGRLVAEVTPCGTSIDDAGVRSGGER
jgi:hypothetical protein